MSTRATIEIKDRYETFYVYRHCDGFPEDVMPDIEIAVKKRPYESGILAAYLVTFGNKGLVTGEENFFTYELTSCFHGDESYKYFVHFDPSKKEWEKRIE